MTDGADLRRTAGEELLPMAVQAGLVRREVGHIRKSHVPRTNGLPIARREVMARCTLLLVLCDQVRKLCDLSGASGCATALGFGSTDRSQAVVRQQAQGQQDANADNEQSDNRSYVRSIDFHCGFEPILARPLRRGL